MTERLAFQIPKYSSLSSLGKTMNPRLLIMGLTLPCMEAATHWCMWRQLQSALVYHDGAVSHWIGAVHVPVTIWKIVVFIVGL